MADVKAQTVHIYEDPESRVQFLEETLTDKDWRTVLIYPDATPEWDKRREETRAALVERGYVVTEGRDIYRHPVLFVHHIGKDTPMSTIVREMGLARGAGLAIANPGWPIGQVLHEGQKGLRMLQRGAMDPAKVNGFFFTLAEVFLAFSGFGNKGKITDPKNLLQSLAGTLFLGQSLTFLALAKSNDELAYNQLKKKIERSKAAGGDERQFAFDSAQDLPPQGIGETITRLVNKYPIQIGSMFNNLGMVAYAGHALLMHRDSKKILSSALAGSEEYQKAMKYAAKGTFNGFHKDILGASLSMVAWFLLMVPPKRHDPEQPRPQNPLQNAWEHMQENPQVGTGLLTLSSSTFRLLGASSKGNRIQKIGESIYLPGDFVLLFTKNDEYGNNASDNLDKLAGRLANHINDMPMVFGYEARVKMVQQWASYLEEYSFQSLPAKQQTPEKRRALTERSSNLVHDVVRKVTKQENNPLDRLADASAALVQRFPVEQRAALQKALAETLSQMEWVHATPVELERVIQIATPPGSSVHSKLVQMKDIRKEVADLTFTVPGIDAAAVAIHLHDALKPFFRQQANDAPQLQEALQDRALQSVGRIPASVSASVAR